MGTKPSAFDRNIALKAFDDTKAGVKGLVDAGFSKVPTIFLHSQPNTDSVSKSASVINEEPVSDAAKFTIPVIDLGGINEDPHSRSSAIEKVHNACSEWGFFQVINHGIPDSLLEDAIDGIRRFHEQDSEAKKDFYSRDETRKVMYNTNFDLYQASAANWRDTLYCLMAPVPPLPHHLPTICSDELISYSEEVMKLGLTIFELMSQALGLEPNHLRDMGCAEGLYVLGHYYPECPEPELTLGLSKHTDSSFLTVLLQDQTGGLQVLHQGQWVDINPIPGSLVVNLGDMSQLITNDKFKSVYHRVVTKRVGPRISIPCFFRTHYLQQEGSERVYEPIKELVSEESPARYRATTIHEYVSCVYSIGLDGSSKLGYFEL
ncbi:1-aminocyclopropane-1-carboxylate oxidase homolog 1 [Linum perenne]